MFCIQNPQRFPTLYDIHDDLISDLSCPTKPASKILKGVLRYDQLTGGGDLIISGQFIPIKFWRDKFGKNLTKRMSGENMNKEGNRK